MNVHVPITSVRPVAMNQEQFLQETELHTNANEHRAPHKKKYSYLCNGIIRGIHGLETFFSRDTNTDMSGLS
jgi:hypothetical protein